MIRAPLLASIALPPLLLSHPAAALDASFGCKVLLCAAGAAPSWNGIPYCAPVMEQLFTQLAKGDRWPTCAEGNASPVGYQPFDACPAGTVPIADDQVSASARGGYATTTYSASASGSECGAPTPLQTGSLEGCNGASVGGAAATTNYRSGATALRGGQCVSLKARPRECGPLFRRHNHRQRRLEVHLQPSRVRGMILAPNASLERKVP